MVEHDSKENWLKEVLLHHKIDQRVEKTIKLMAAEFSDVHHPTEEAMTDVIEMKVPYPIIEDALLQIASKKEM